MAGDDGFVLSEYRVDLPAARSLRSHLRLQSAAWHSDLGAGFGADDAGGSDGRNGTLMNLERVNQIAKAVLYEGYMLYPYGPSSVKNRQRWNFGVVYPQAYNEAQGGEEPCSMQTECLVSGNAGARLEVKLRFLHLQLRATSTSSQVR